MSKLRRTWRFKSTIAPSCASLSRVRLSTPKSNKRLASARCGQSARGRSARRRKVGRLGGCPFKSVPCTGYPGSIAPQAHSDDAAKCPNEGHDEDPEQSGGVEGEGI